MPAEGQTDPITGFMPRENCPVCGETRGTPLYRAPYDAAPIRPFLSAYYGEQPDLDELVRGGVYEATRCASCSLVFQRFVGKEPLLEALYDRWVNVHDPEANPAYRFDLDNYARSRDGHELLAVGKALGKPLSALRVLDYGMGWALWAQIAVRLGASVYGFDFSQERMARAAQFGVKTCSLDEIPGLGLDFINTEQVFEHLADPLRTATLLASGLRPGGVLKISVPRADDIAHRLERENWMAPLGSRDSLHPLHPIEHVNCFNPRSLKALARKIGLEPYRIPLRAYYGFAVEPRAIPPSPRRLLKAAARPMFHWFSRSNLYLWFQKPIAS
jgi:SAM-dependent methyltransferase